MLTVLLVVLVLVMLGVFPTWPYAANWGYGPSGMLLLLVVVLLVFMFTGRA